MVERPAYIGKPVSRYDGVEKVTGAARYAADHLPHDCAHAMVVSSGIARGRIASLKIDEATRVAGVLAVFSHLNCPEVAASGRSYKDQVSPSGSPFRPFRNEHIVYSGQPVALVVAEDFETARYAASLVTVEYEADEAETDLAKARVSFPSSDEDRIVEATHAKSHGDVARAVAEAATTVAGEYHSPAEHHNPMEMHATTVVWVSDDELVIYDKTQGAVNCRNYVSKVFGYDRDRIAVVAPYVGGAFGSGLRPQYQLFLAVLAARAMKRSVQLMLTRQQMFTFGHRPETIQDVALAATEGGLTAVSHAAFAATSTFEDFEEHVTAWSEQLYGAANAHFEHRLAKLDLYTPCDMRAPGGSLGLFALESAMDELAHATGIDPVELRLKNYSDLDHEDDRPYAVKELRQCIEQGAARFDWARRKPTPRSTQSGTELLGHGMATGIWGAKVLPTQARAALRPDGKIEIASAMADIGTGTHTIVSQIAAETLDVPLQDVVVKLGDSRLPNAPVEGGSFGAASVGTAVQAACLSLRPMILRHAARLNDAPTAGVAADELVIEGGCVIIRDDPERRISLLELMHGMSAPLEADGSSAPSVIETARSYVGMQKYSHFTHSATFAEVGVDEDLGVVRVKRILAAIDAGRILNPKTARSQIIGGVVWGMGMALYEESLLDHAYGRFMNHSLAEYHIAVNADVPDIDVIFVETPDTELNPLGAKGLGEIGIVGTAAAIGNAVFNATGKRVRNLPITLDKLL